MLIKTIEDFDSLNTNEFTVQDNQISCKNPQTPYKTIDFKQWSNKKSRMNNPMKTVEGK